MIATDKQNGKSMTKSQKKSNSLKGVALLVSKSSPSSSIALNVSSRLLMDFFSASSPLSMSAASKTSSLLLSTLKIKKRLVLDSPQAKKKANCMDMLKNQEPKLAAYEVDWFNSTSTKNKCLKHTSKNNLPVIQEEQIIFLLNKYQTSTIKMAFADAIGKVGTAARKFFYPFPHRKDKLICSFLELIYDGKSIMIDNSKDSFR